MVPASKILLRRTGRKQSPVFTGLVAAFVLLSNVNLKMVKATGQSDMQAIEIVRNSIGFDSDFQEVPANHGRYKNICIVSKPKITIYSDKPGRVAFAVDGNQVLCGYGAEVQTTTDGTQFNTLCNTYSDEPFVSHRIPQDFITCIEVLPDGSWILAMGCPSEPNQQGNLFRSTDKGQTWTWVKQFERGFPIGSQWYAVANNEVAIGEYGYRFQPNSCRRIYYSDDYGATWSKIYEPEPNEQHVHLAAFKPGNTDVLYIAYGDGEPAAKVIKLQYTPGPGGKKDPNNWSETSNSPIYISNPACGFSDGKYLYWGHDGSFIEPVIWRLDPIDDTIKNVLDWPEYRDSNNSPYRQANPRGEVRSMCLHDGVYYAPVASEAESTFRVGGIYVSADGEHWVAAYRVGQSAQGFYTIVGYANGYLWGTYWGLAGTNLLFRMEPVNTAFVEALQIEKGVNNIFNNPADSSFEDSIGKWYMQYDINNVSSGISTECRLHGSSSLKVVCSNKGYGFTLVNSGKWSDMDGNPCVGDYICASFWIKGAPTWPAVYKSFADIYVVGGGSIEFNQSYFTVVDDWQKVTIWGRCTSQITGYVGLRIFLDDSGYDGNFSDATCYIDCVQVAYSPTLHDSGSWQIGGIPRDDEYAYQSLAGLGQQFTTTFEWRPELSSREWHRDITIASWTDGPNSVDLYYDIDMAAFVASDGTYSCRTTKLYTWEHLDSIKLALTNSDGYFTLSVQSPLVGSEHVVSAGTLLAAPVGVRFGTDSSFSSYGCGLIATVRHWDGALDSSEIEKIWNVLRPVGDLNNDWDVDMKDFSIFSQYWLESGNVADFDKNGIIDWSDLMSLCNNWLEGL